MNKKYVWLLGPILAGGLGWGFSGNWKLGLTLLIATGLGNYYTYLRLK